MEKGEVVNTYEGLRELDGQYVTWEDSGIRRKGKMLSYTNYVVLWNNTISRGYVHADPIMGYTKGITFGPSDKIKTLDEYCIKPVTNEKLPVIDITKSQVIEGDVKCWVKGYEHSEWFPDHHYLAVVNHAADIPYGIWGDYLHAEGSGKGSDHNFILSKVYYVRYCTLIDPFPPTKMTKEEAESKFNLIIEE